jgi:hypothetical protein
VHPSARFVDNFVRDFEGVSYRLLRGDKVREFVLGIANAEWEPDDFETYGDDLLCSVWELREVELEQIKPNEKLLAFSQFQEDLKPRIAEIKTLLQNSQAIRPLILRGSDLLIFDGYARYQALKGRGIGKCLAYVGKRSRE